MSVNLRVRTAVCTRRDKVLRLAAIGLMAALAQGCSAGAIAPVGGPDASDPSVRVPPARYRSTFASYLSQRPVAPRSWREQNERVAPTPKR